MADEPDNLVLALLRQMRGSLDRLENDMSGVKLRLHAIGSNIGTMHLQLSAMNGRMDRFDERVARIERRLELREPV